MPPAPAPDWGSPLPGNTCELSVESTPGAGSTFRFVLTLPGAVAADSAPNELGEITGLLTDHQDLRILIAEDNADARRLLQQLLLPFGMTVAEAADGATSVIMAASFAPDLIIMDWRMPELDGIEATRQIRAQNATKRPKIVMLTASAFEEQRAEALAAGADAYLRKPLQEKELYATLETQLGIHLQRRAGGSASVSAAAPGGAATELDVATLAAGLARLLPERRAGLREAVEEMNPAKIKALVIGIEAEHPQLAQEIAQMASAYRYQELWQCLQEIK